MCKSILFPGTAAQTALFGSRFESVRGAASPPLFKADIVMIPRRLKGCMQQERTCGLRQPPLMSVFVEEVNKIKKSPSYGLADFGHGTRDDKCALAIIQSALIIL